MDYYKEFDSINNINRRILSLKKYIDIQRNVIQGAEWRIREKSGIMKNERISFNVDYDLSKFPSIDELYTHANRMENLISNISLLETELRGLKSDLTFYLDYLVNHEVVINHEIKRSLIKKSFL